MEFLYLLVFGLSYNFILIIFCIIALILARCERKYIIWIFVGTAIQVLPSLGNLKRLSFLNESDPLYTYLLNNLAIGLICSVAIIIGTVFWAKALRKKAIIKRQNTDSSISSTSTKTFPNSFVCTKCNQTRTGWYQTCPNCGAVGTMVKAEDPQPEVKTLAHSDIPQPTVSDSKTSLDNVQTMTANVCRFCGYKFPSDWLFCSNCGKKV